ncbi:protein of unknown function DUF803 [Actinobacteria bacterium OK074]|nr:protein of unknown function DUF803 [Actinobacteria bacterium OK074]
MSALALSVLLSFVSAVAYAGGAIIQEQVAVSSTEHFAPLRRASWWAAIALNGLGGLLHVVALAYGPLSLVQPLGALTIVFALPMAALFVGRKAGSTAWRGAIMATVGLAGLLSLVGSGGDSHSLSGLQRVAVALVSGGAVLALMAAGRAAHRHPAMRSVLLATGSGIAFGMSSVFTKTLTVDWDDAVTVATLLTLVVTGVFAVAGVLLSQAAYRGAGLAAPLAVLTVVNPVVAAAVGITMFGETFRYGVTGTMLALGCGVVAAGGLVLLTTERLAGERRTARRAATAAPDGAPETVAATSAVAATEPVPDPAAAGDPSAPAAPTGSLTSVEALLASLPSARSVDPLQGLHDKVFVPFPAAAQDGGAFAPERDDAFPRVPVPVLDRHRARVKS